MARRGIGFPRARFVTVLALLLGLIVVEVGLDNRGLSVFLLDLSSAAILFIALVFGVIETRWPGSLVVSDGRHASFPDLIYFSFVTLLTIGFGDVVPATGAARAVTLLEGLFGVVYTTVVMAALVAAYLSQRGSPLSPEPDEARVGVAGRGRDDDAPPADVQ